MLHKLIHLFEFLDSNCKQFHMMFVFLNQTSFTSLIVSRSIHVATNGTISPFFMAE